MNISLWQTPTLPAATTKQMLTPPTQVSESPLAAISPAQNDSPTPVTTVTLSAAKPAQEKSPTYEQPLVNVVQVRNQQDTTPAAAAMTKQLGATLSSFSSGKSNFSVGNIFSQIGNLSRETTEYRNEARSTKMANDKLSDKFAIDFSTSKGNQQHGVTLSIRTKDGDTIDINISQSRSTSGDNLEFSFVVTGELSEAEQDAIEKLTAKLGNMADDFFNAGSASLRGLKDIDKTVIQGFNVEFKKPDGEKFSTMSYDFSLDDIAQTQQLKAKDIHGYSIDIKTDLQGILKESGNSSQNSLHEYLRIIRKALNEHQASSQSSSFIVDSFSSAIMPSNPSENSAPVSPLSAFDTGLADFTLIIQAPLHHNRHNYLYPEAMQLTLEQNTSQEQHGERTIAKQTSSYELNSSRIKGAGGGPEGDLKFGHFNYKTMHVKEQVSRLLDVTNDVVNNMYTENNYSVNKDRKSVV